MEAALSAEMRSVVFDAAHPLRAGETIKAQQNRAARNLGFVEGHWRVRAAWNGEAGCWSGAAVEDFRARYRAWKERRTREGQAEAELVASRLRRLREALALVDAGSLGPEISALDRAIRLLGHGDRTVDRG